MDSCPKELEPYEIAHKKQIMEKDLLAHTWWGTYGLSALTVAVEHCLYGKKAKSEYIKKPIMADFEKTKESVQITEDEKKKQTEQLFLQLQIMGINHKHNHKGSTVS